MPTINNLSAVTSLAGADQIPIWSAANGDARKASLTTLLAYIEANFAQPGLTKQTAAPTSTGFTVTVAASTEDKIWLVLSPTGAFAAGTIVLPLNAGTFDGQSVLVTCSQAITTLTVTGTGTVTGEPTRLIAGGFFEVKFDATLGQWFCTSSSLSVDDTLTINTSSASVAVAAAGTGANISIALTPKGTGGVTTPASFAADEVNAASAIIATVNLNEANFDPTTVAGLTGGIEGQRRFVTDATQAMTAGIGAIVAGGGANNVPVHYDGTNWRIG